MAVAAGTQTLRNRSLLAIAFALIWLPIFEAKAIAAEGLITIQSHYGPRETMQRLEAAVKAKGFSVFAHIDHSAQAAQVNLSLLPTDLLIFGNPKGGTPLMRSDQTVGIDLPLKALVWQDEKGTIWLSYNDPEWLVRRHGGAPGTEDTVRAISDALKALAANATSAE
ncbi:DUF302 domain-containing protein [Bradyrhizobium genosp. A]|uniref:DUF302 domain-containing protein n=1 Tax=Bradyrhizobium genosp. A TaxID=83626 RepID=UPI003CF635A7